MLIIYFLFILFSLKTRSSDVQNLAINELLDEFFVRHNPNTQMSKIVISKKMESQIKNSILEEYIKIKSRNDIEQLKKPENLVSPSYSHRSAGRLKKNKIESNFRNYKLHNMQLTTKKLVDIEKYKYQRNSEFKKSFSKSNIFLKQYYFKKSLNTKENYELRFVKDKIIKKYVKNLKQKGKKKLKKKHFRNLLRYNLILRKAYISLFKDTCGIKNGLYNFRHDGISSISEKKESNLSNKNYEQDFFDGKIPIEDHLFELFCNFNKMDYINRLKRDKTNEFYDMFLKAEKSFCTYYFKKKPLLINNFLKFDQNDLLNKIKIIYSKNNTFSYIKNFCYFVEQIIIEKGLEISLIDELHKSFFFNPNQEFKENYSNIIKGYFNEMLIKNYKIFVFLFPECIFLIKMLDLYKNFQLKFFSSQEAILFFTNILILEKFLLINWKDYLDCIKKKTFNINKNTCSDKNIKEIIKASEGNSYINLKRELVFDFLKLKHSLNEILIYIFSKFFPFYIYCQFFKLKKFENLNLINNYKMRYKNKFFNDKLVYKFSLCLTPLFFSHTYLNEIFFENIDDRKKNSFDVFYLDKKNDLISKFRFKYKFICSPYNYSMFFNAFTLSLSPYIENDIDFYTDYAGKKIFTNCLTSEFLNKFNQITEEKEMLDFLNCHDLSCLEAFDQVINVLQKTGLINYL
ncbi:hypothetical protein GVAV_002132 [Gurleya vavrai]